MDSTQKVDLLALADECLGFVLEQAGVQDGKTVSKEVAFGSFLALLSIARDVREITEGMGERDRLLREIRGAQ